MALPNPSSTPAGESRFARLGLLALALLAASRTASAAGAAALIDWDGPEPCPGALDVYARLSSVLGYEPETLGKLSQVRGSVVRTATGYRLVLEAFEDGRRSSRLFEAASCDDLGDAAALAIALAMAPPGGSETTSPAPTQPTKTATDAPKPPDPADAASAASGTRSEAPRVRGFAAASVLLEDGALPAPAPGIEVSGGARWGRVSIGAYGVLLGSQLRAVAPAQDVQFSLWFGGVRGCYSLLDGRLELDACASFEAGRFGALGLGLQPARSSSNPWLALGGGLAARWPLINSLGLELRGEPVLPLVRKEYTVNGRDEVHAPAAGSARVYLGLTLLGG